MSITVNIYYTGTNGSARKFAEEMVSTGTVEAIRNEEGNIRYDYFFPMDDAETVLLTPYRSFILMILFMMSFLKLSGFNTSTNVPN